MTWLDAFVTLAKHGSQTEAAKVLGCNQSTVSRYVRGLERWLRKPLVDTIVPLRLSKDGDEFLPVAEMVLGVLEAHRAPYRPKTSAKSIDMDAFFAARGD